jgi:hypothetical protein
MNFTIVFAADSDSEGCGLIAASPQWPEPPLMILAARVSISDDPYRLATSEKAGPINFSLSLWQLRQSFLTIKSAPLSVDVAIEIVFWFALDESDLFVFAPLLTADVSFGLFWLLAFPPQPDIKKGRHKMIINRFVICLNKWFTNWFND